jgi:DNA-binding NtrC family response regulator
MNNCASGTRTSVLVVDDTPDVCEFMQAALEGAGYDVQVASEGGRALVLQRRNPAAVLITDLFMPEQEGMATIAAFKAEFPRTRIIAMTAGTGYGKHDFLAAAELIGADASLRKPFDADQLLQMVGTVLADA